MFQKIREKLDNKNILILGYGKEGRSTLKFIIDFIDYKSITIADKCIIDDEFPNGIHKVFGDNYMDDLDAYDIIVKSPGIVYKSVNQTVIEKTTSQTDLFLEEFSEYTIGITGTKGKSTTTTLIYHVLKNFGIDAVLTGNIGIPPLESARKMSNKSVAVFEMSCHQLEYSSISPKFSIILNLYEDHLDHYVTRENYIKAKENIFLHQSSDDYLIINEECREQISKAKSQVLTVGVNPESKYSYCCGKINSSYAISDDISLIGEHNRINITFAYVVAKQFGVTDCSFSESLKTYSPLPHRLEFVACKNGIEYYDDSISTIPETTIQAIKSIKNVGSVIIGGMDRGIDYTELVDFFVENPIDNIILTYDSGRRIAELLSQKGVSFIFAENLESAVLLADKLTRRGGACVLSPAAASYGFFKNFEERGDVFKALVNKL